jgi:hypothetical protein
LTSPAWLARGFSMLTSWAMSQALGPLLGAFIGRALRITGKALLILVPLLVALDARGESDLIPLQQYLDLPADRRTPAYPMIRCAGIHSGLLAYGGANFTPDNARQAESAVTFLTSVAVFIRVRLEGGTVEALSRDVVNSVNLVSSLYAQRARDNYARTGEAFGSDPLILGDLELCRHIADDLMKRFPELVQ